MSEDERINFRKRAILGLEKIFPDQRIVVITVKGGMVGLAANCPREDVKAIVESVAKHWGDVQSNVQ